MLARRLTLFQNAAFVFVRSLQAVACWRQFCLFCNDAGRCHVSVCCAKSGQKDWTAENHFGGAVHRHHAVGDAVVLSAVGSGIFSVYFSNGSHASCITIVQKHTDGPSLLQITTENLIFFWKQDLVPKSHRGRWNSLEQIAWGLCGNGSSIVGKKLKNRLCIAHCCFTSGGYIVDAHGFAVCFVVTAAIYFASTLPTWSMVCKKKKTNNHNHCFSHRLALFQSKKM